MVTQISVFAGTLGKENSKESRPNMALANMPSGAPSARSILLIPTDVVIVPMPVEKSFGHRQLVY